MSICHSSKCFLLAFTRIWKSSKNVVVYPNQEITENESKTIKENGNLRGTRVKFRQRENQPERLFIFLLNLHYLKYYQCHVLNVNISVKFKSTHTRSLLLFVRLIIFLKATERCNVRLTTTVITIIYIAIILLTAGLHLYYYYCCYFYFHYCFYFYFYYCGYYYFCYTMMTLCSFITSIKTTLVIILKD